VSAFRTLQSGKLSGKIVIVPRPDDMVMVSPFDIFGVVEYAHILTAIPGLSAFT
jgi:hypothetical protein